MPEIRTMSRQSILERDEVQLLTFVLNQQEFALDIAKIIQVVRMVAVTGSPKAHPAIKGMINVRGKVIPVVSLRRLFDMEERRQKLNDHLLIARSDKRMVALLVDMVREVLIVPTASLQPPNELGAEIKRYVDSVAKFGDRLVLILDLPKCLTFLEDDMAEASRIEGGTLQERLAQLLADMTGPARI